MTWRRVTHSTLPALGRDTRARIPHVLLLTKFVCPNQSVAGKLEAAIKRLPAAEKRKLVGTTGAAARKLLLD